MEDRCCALTANDTFVFSYILSIHPWRKLAVSPRCSSCGWATSLKPGFSRALGPFLHPWAQSRASQGVQSHEMETISHQEHISLRNKAVCTWYLKAVDSAVPKGAAVLVHGVSWRACQLARLLSANLSSLLSASQPLLWCGVGLSLCSPYLF